MTLLVEECVVVAEPEVGQQVYQVSVAILGQKRPFPFLFPDQLFHDHQIVK